MKLYTTSEGYIRAINLTYAELICKESNISLKGELVKVIDEYTGIVIWDDIWLN